ncbi:MAG: hypothetical protein ACKVVP_02495 [Chloroflexota bacterium]
MNYLQWQRVYVTIFALVLSALPYLAYVGFAWYRFGRVRAATGDDQSVLLDQFMPEYEVAERHEIAVNASAEVTFAAACLLDLQASPVVRAIFLLRTVPGRLRGEPSVSFRRGILDETLSLGWGMLSKTPGRQVIMGAVTRPWDESPVFQAVPAHEFASYAEPGYAKIVWTLDAIPRDGGGAVFRTETRVQTTDAASRSRFRRYWALLSPGILTIRHQALSLVKEAAERESAFGLRDPNGRLNVAQGSSAHQ